MEKELKPWITFSPLHKNDTESEIIQKLFNLIYDSKCVKDKKEFEKVMKETMLRKNGKINDLLTVFHAQTETVNHLCASVIAGKNGRTYAMVAYTQPSDFCLKRLSLLLEGLTDYTSTGYIRLQKSDSSKEPELSDIFPPAFLQKKDISFYDYEEKFLNEGLI
ncbi:MAG: hypothetical protein IJ688_14495 [Treponema sp.]|nr:hypothetical protein [Treponema sp.]